MTIPNRTFGVELEIKGLNTQQAAQALISAGINAIETGYTHARSEYWKVLTDSSLTDPTGRCCEVVSPVLRGEEGIEALRKVCRTLSAAGARVDRQCGLHVHVGTDGLSANDVAMILSRYARFESVIDSWMPASRRGSDNSYCRSIIPEVSARINGRTFASIQSVASSMGGDRYRKVNMEAYSRHRTIEFRQHSGSINGTKIENWVRFILAFVESSRNQSVTVEVSETPAFDSFDPFDPLCPARQTLRPFDPFRPVRRPLRRSVGVRRNSMDAKLDRVILAFRAAPGQRLSEADIAIAGGWSVASVPPYISRLRSERGCVLRKVRGSSSYVLIGNSGRLSTDASPQSDETLAPTVAVETQRAARRVEGVAHIANDSVFRGIPEEVISYFEERAEELGAMNR